LILDFFVENQEIDCIKQVKEAVTDSSQESSKIGDVFKTIEATLSGDIVAQTGGIFKFVLQGTGIPLCCFLALHSLQ